MSESSENQTAARVASSCAAPAECAQVDDRTLRERLLVLTLISVTALAATLGTLGAPLIVAVTQEYGVTPVTAQWTISLPCLVGAACMPLVSWLASTRHRRRTTLAILALMALGSVAAALPLGFGVLLAGRSLHGLGLGLLPITVAAARESLAGERRDRAIAALSVANVVGAGVSFAAVGVLLDLGGPSLAYLAAGVTAALAFALAAWAMPGPDSATPDRPVDAMGSLLLAAAGTALVLGLTRGEINGWLSSATASSALVAVVLIAAWIWQSLRTPYPLIDLRRAITPLPLSVYVTSLTGGSGMFMMLTFVMVIAQTPSSTPWGLGMSASTAGLMMLPYAVGSVGGSRLSAGVRRRYRPQSWLPLGCTLYAIAAAVLLIGHDHSLQLLAAMAVAGVAAGFSFAHMPGLLVLSVTTAETGAAVGFSMVIRLLGFSVGATVAGLLLSGESGQPVTSSGVDAALTVHLCWWLLAILTAVSVGRLPERRAAVGE